MKPIFLATFSLLLSSLGLSFDHSEYDRTLKNFVNSEGMVAYAKLKANRTALDNYLEATGAVSEKEFQSWQQPEQLAFLINVYNAETLQYIIDNYPVESIRKLGGLLSSAWDRKNVILFGEKTTLNHLEHKIIRKDYTEPRIHFALVCAAKSCPPLRTEAYTGSRLESQLEDQTKKFLAQQDKNRLEGDTLYLSSIFDWYGGDFTKNGKTLNEYLSPYFGGNAVGKEIKFTDYDWSLNDQ